MGKSEVGVDRGAPIGPIKTVALRRNTQTAKIQQGNKRLEKRSGGFTVKS